MSDLPLAWLDGLYVGQLSEGELRMFDQAVKDGWAVRSYNGPGGWLGLAKVRICEPGAENAT